MSRQIVQSAYGVTLVGGGDATPALVTKALTIAPYLVAADGGADLALAAGHLPDAVIGDFDSISAAARRTIPAAHQHVIAEQETTDFEKCLLHITAPFVLALGFTGARMDHTLAVLTALIQHPGKTCLVLGVQDVCFLAPLQLALDLPVGTRLSLYPMGPVAGHSSGLLWPITGLDFAPDGRVGTSNQTTAARVDLRFDAARMLVILPLDCLSQALSALAPDAPRRARGE